MPCACREDLLKDGNWPLLDASFNILEEETLQRLETVEDNVSKFDCMSAGDKTLQLRHNMFISASVQGSRTYQLM